MKLDKAIKILGRKCGHPSGLTLKEILEAEQLGIEALKSKQSDRLANRPNATTRLKGETED